MLVFHLCLTSRLRFSMSAAKKSSAKKSAAKKTAAKKATAVKSPAKQHAEYSANFDTDTLEILIERVNVQWPDIMTDQRVADFLKFVRGLKHEDQKNFGFNAMHEGVRKEIVFTVFMDDIDAPDVYFLAFPEFIQSIESEHEKLCEELGI